MLKVRAIFRELLELMFNTAALVVDTLGHSFDCPFILDRFPLPFRAGTAFQASSPMVVRYQHLSAARLIFSAQHYCFTPWAR